MEAIFQVLKYAGYTITFLLFVGVLLAIFLLIWLAFEFIVHKPKNLTPYCCIINSDCVNNDKNCIECEVYKSKYKLDD